MIGAIQINLDLAMYRFFVLAGIPSAVCLKGSDGFLEEPKLLSTLLNFIKLLAPSIVARARAPFRGRQPRRSLELLQITDASTATDSAPSTLQKRSIPSFPASSIFINVLGRARRSPLRSLYYNMSAGRHPAAKRVGSPSKSNAVNE